MRCRGVFGASGIGDNAALVVSKDVVADRGSSLAFGRNEGEVRQAIDGCDPAVIEPDYLRPRGVRGELQEGGRFVEDLHGASHYARRRRRRRRRSWFRFGFRRWGRCWFVTGVAWEVDVSATHPDAQYVGVASGSCAIDVAVVAGDRCEPTAISPDLGSVIGSEPIELHPSCGDGRNAGLNGWGCWRWWQINSWRCAAEVEKRVTPGFDAVDAIAVLADKQASIDRRNVEDRFLGVASRVPIKDRSVIEVKRDDLLPCGEVADVLVTEGYVASFGLALPRICECVGRGNRTVASHEAEVTAGVDGMVCDLDAKDRVVRRSDPLRVVYPIIDAVE